MYIKLAYKTEIKVKNVILKITFHVRLLTQIPPNIVRIFKFGTFTDATCKNKHSFKENIKY